VLQAKRDVAVVGSLARKFLDGDTGNIEKIDRDY
jgi:hypothetical protein